MPVTVRAAAAGATRSYCHARALGHGAFMAPRGDHADYLSFVRRVLRAAGRRVGHANPEDLAELARVRDELDAVIDGAVAALRAQGYSWAAIAAPLGVTRQAAQQRFGVNATLTRRAG
jgi:hypothetical protein